MKAMNLIRCLVYDSTMAENGGTINYDGTCSLRDHFGAVQHTGEVLHGNYFYLYCDRVQQEYLYDGFNLYKPDVEIETEEAGMVCLWRIEE